MKINQFDYHKLHLISQCKCEVIRCEIKDSIKGEDAYLIAILFLCPNYEEINKLQPRMKELLDIMNSTKVK